MCFASSNDNICAFMLSGKRWANCISCWADIGSSQSISIAQQHSQYSMNEMNSLLNVSRKSKSEIEFQHKIRL